MLDAVLDPFRYGFFLRGLLAAALAGGLCGLIGVPVVLRKMSYIGHGLSHSIFGGAVVSYLLKINFYVGAGMWGFLSAVLINNTSRRYKIGADASIGIVTTASFALGVALISRVHSFTRNFDAALFGNVLGVETRDLVILAAVAVAAATAIFLGYKQLLFCTFDSEVAESYGVPVGQVEMVFSIVLAATIVACMQILGVTLIAAAIVIPSTTARMLTHSFSRMLVLATAMGSLTGFGGMYLSWYLNIPSGASIVLLSASMFMLVCALSNRH